MAYNLLILTRAGLGEEVSGAEALSSYHMATEVAAVATGLSIAVPASAWQRFAAMTTAEFAGWLCEVAGAIDWRRYRKKPRGAKAPRDVKRTRRGAHRSTARELKSSRKKAP